MAISGAPTSLRPPLHPAWIGRYLDGKRRSRVNHAARRLPLGGIGPAIQRNAMQFWAGPRKYVGLGKTTAELEAGGNFGQGRVAYEDRVNQRKQNVAMRRRAKYLARSRRMGRQPRAYRSDRLGGLNSAIGRKYGSGVGPPGGGGVLGGGWRGGGFGSPASRGARGSRPPRKYRSSASRSNDDRFGAGNLETLFGPP